MFGASNCSSSGGVMYKQLYGINRIVSTNRLLTRRITFCVVQCALAMRMVFTERNRINMAAAKSEREAKMNYTIQQFGRNICVAILPVELCGSNLQQVLSCLKYWRRSDNLSDVYYAFYPP
jgi:hypothetical protein